MAALPTSMFAWIALSQVAWAGHHSADDPLLAETVGLLMEYAVVADRRDLFDEQNAVIHDVLTAPSGLLAWRAWPDEHKLAEASASIDDLVVIGALLDGAARWGERSLVEQARGIGDAALRLETEDGVLRDGASWDEGGSTVSTTVQTSYLDLRTMQRLATLDPRWGPVYQGSLTALRGAQTPDGLFPERLPADDSAVVNAIPVLYCALHLAEVGQGGQQTLALFEAGWRQTGRLEGRYRLADAAPVPGFESLAVYALATRLADTLGRASLAEQWRQGMIDFQLLDPLRAQRWGPWAPRQPSRFDSLQALLTMAEVPS